MFIHWSHEHQKKLANCFYLFLLLTLSTKCDAQNFMQAVLINNHGILGQNIITKEELMSINTLGAVLVHKEAVYGAPVVHYEVLMISESDTIVIAGMTGAITKVLKEKFQTLKPGSRVIFQRIKAAPSEEGRSVPLLEITLKA